MPDTPYICTQALPDSALQIDDFEGRKDELLPLSVSAFRCSDLEKGRFPLDSKTAAEEGSSNKGIWGFFFDSVGTGEDEYTPVFDSNGKLIRTEQEFSLVRGSAIRESTSTRSFSAESINVSSSSSTSSSSSSKSVSIPSSSTTATIDTASLPQTLPEEIVSREMLVKLCLLRTDVLSVILRVTHAVSKYSKQLKSSNQ